MNETRRWRGVVPRLFGLLLGAMIAHASPSFAGTIPAATQTYWGMSGTLSYTNPKTWFSAVAACQGYYGETVGKWWPANSSWELNPNNNFCTVKVGASAYPSSQAQPPRHRVERQLRPTSWVFL
jgi:hypothetical protein